MRVAHIHSRNLFVFLTGFTTLVIINSLTGATAEFLSDLTGDARSTSAKDASRNGIVVGTVSQQPFLWDGNAYTRLSDVAQVSYNSLGLPRISGDGKTVYFTAGSEFSKGVIMKWEGSIVIEYVDFNGTSYADLSIEDTSYDGSIIVGTVLQSNPMAYRLVNGNIQELGTMGHGSSAAAAVSDDGSVVVGVTRNTDTTGTIETAFQWKDGLMSALPVPDGTIESEASDISGDGMVVCGRRETSTMRHPVVWMNGSLVDLPLPDGKDKGWASNINHDGSVALGHANGVPVIWINDGGWSVFFLQQYMENLGADFRGLEIDTPYLSGDGNTVIGRVILANNNTTVCRIRLGEPDVMYGPYAVNPDGYTDTTPWLGWLWVERNPWVWSTDMNQWLYCPGDYITEAGSWVYVPK